MMVSLDLIPEIGWLLSDMRDWNFPLYTSNTLNCRRRQLPYTEVFPVLMLYTLATHHKQRL